MESGLGFVMMNFAEQGIGYRQAWHMSRTVMRLCGIMVNPSARAFYI